MWELQVFNFQWLVLIMEFDYLTRVWVQSIMTSYFTIKTYITKRKCVENDKNCETLNKQEPRGGNVTAFDFFTLPLCAKKKHPKKRINQ